MDLYLLLKMGHKPSFYLLPDNATKSDMLAIDRQIAVIGSHEEDRMQKELADG